MNYSAQFNDSNSSFDSIHSSGRTHLFVSLSDHYYFNLRILLLDPAAYLGNAITAHSHLDQSYWAGSCTLMALACFIIS